MLHLWNCVATGKQPQRQCFIQAQRCIHSCDKQHCSLLNKMLKKIENKALLLRAAHQICILYCAGLCRLNWRLTENELLNDMLM